MDEKIEKLYVVIIQHILMDFSDFSTVYRLLLSVSFFFLIFFSHRKQHYLLSIKNKLENKKQFLLFLLAMERKQQRQKAIKKPVEINEIIACN